MSANPEYVIVSDQVKGELRKAVNQSLEAYIADIDKEIAGKSDTIPDWPDSKVHEHIENFGHFLIC